MLLLGNFNIRVNDNEDPDTITFNDFLESFDTCNQVFFPTHRLSNTLDFLVNPEQNNTIANLKQGRLFSDHHTILFDLFISDCAVVKKKVAYRKTAKIN